MKPTILMTALSFSLAFTSAAAEAKSREIMLTSKPNGARVETSKGDKCYTPCIINVGRRQTVIASYFFNNQRTDVKIDRSTMARHGSRLEGHIILDEKGQIFDVEKGQVIPQHARSYHVDFTK